MANPKPTLAALSQRYATALRRHLGVRVGSSLRAALRLGQMAVECGLETLELARLHQSTLEALKGANPGKEAARRAESFFADALTPILDSHRTAREGRARLERLGRTLKRRDAELVTSNLRLQQGIVQRKTVEAALKRSGVRHSTLVKESLRLQAGLRKLTHELMEAQEDERTKISRELQDEIAQTLLGINIRLIAMRQEARNNAASLNMDIASTGELVLKSVRSVRRVAVQISKP